MLLKNFSINRDAITVNTFESKHRKLTGVWPTNGCINLRRPLPETGEINDKWVVARCQEYLSELIRRNETVPRIARTTVAGRYRDFTCH